ncbi:MAG: M48 family metalloprotease [Thermodesulfobacteriota bacterium]
MIYNNLIYILVALFILSTRTIPETPQLPAGAALLFFLLKNTGYFLLARHLFRTQSQSRATDYFATEQRLSLLAIFSFGLDIYLLDAPYYFARMPLAAALPTIASACGLALFFGYFSLLWSAGRTAYAAVFGRRHRLGSFLAANLKINLAIVLPWLLLSLLVDLLRLAPLPAVKGLLASPWGEPLLILLFFLLLLLVFPRLVVRLWGCTSLPAGPLRRQIDEFCRRHRIGYADIMLWPLFEGRLLTAGVMGITARFRYLLITPALLETMTTEEVEAVIAHEVGHVKHYHLQLYLLFFLGFGLLTQFTAYPFLALLLNSSLFYQAVQMSGRSPVAALTVASSASLLLLMILYFRYLFGFFMRNFERQADLYALTAIGHASPLVRVFEKIAWLSGKIRDLPSWHHFGIGERIDFLRRSEADPACARRHHRKVACALGLFVAALTAGTFFLARLPADLLEGAPKTRFAEALLREKIKEEPANALWHHILGDLRFTLRDFPAARAAYEQALRLAPDNPETLNNLAWLLLAADDQSLLDPTRALALAQKAARLSGAPHVLDTLATAYWATGDRASAVAAGQRALALARENRAYYQEQLQRFRTATFPEPLPIPQ